MQVDQHLIYNHASRSAKDDFHSSQVKKYYIHPQTFLCIQIGILLTSSSLLLLLILSGIVVSNLRKTFKDLEFIPVDPCFLKIAGSFPRFHYQERIPGYIRHLLSNCIYIHPIFQPLV